MNLSLVHAFYAAVSVATVWLALLWVLRSQPRRRPRVLRVALGATALLLLFVPFGGLPLWSRAFSFYPNPSLPVLGLVCAALWQRLLGISVFKPADWRAIWFFGAIAGSVLYLHPMVIGAIDLYYWGWERETATWTLATVAIVLLACGQRLGVLLLAALLAYAVNALESQNCWDYLVDPIYWLMGIAVLIKRACLRALGRRDSRTTALTRETAPDLAPPLMELAPVPAPLVAGEAKPFAGQP
jgi:hypothetical protein